MNWSDIPRHPSRRMLRQFGALLTVAAALAAAWRFTGSQDWRLTAGVAAGAGLLTAAWPTALRWLFVGWMVVAFPIGWLAGRLLLGLAFFGLFVPVGLAMRAMGRDPLQRFGGSRPTYWKAREPRDSASYFRQY